MWAVLPAVLLLAACTRAPAALAEFHDAAQGFTVRHPPGWVPLRREDAVWFVPPDSAAQVPAVSEFIVVVTRPATGQLDDAGMRRVVFELVSVHGVSGFQQDARTTAPLRWYKFELTGDTGGPEWASVGIITAGETGYHIVVCAKALPQWRDGQKQCDEVVRTFQPGPLR